MKNVKKSSKRALAILLTIIMTLSCFSAGFAVIAAAADWVYVAGSSSGRVPVTVYLKSDQLWNGSAGLIGGSNYIIDETGKAKSVTINTTIGSSQLYENETVTNTWYAWTEYIIATDDSITRCEYTRQNSGYLYNSYSKRYLVNNGTTGLTTSTSGVAWTYDTNRIYRSVSGSNRYMYSNSNGIALRTTQSNINSYAQKLTMYMKAPANGGYYRQVGKSTYDVAVGSSLTASQVERAVSVNYKKNSSDTTYETIDTSDSRISLTWNKTLNTSTAGTYTATVKAGGTTIDTITVNVSNVTASDFRLGGKTDFTINQGDDFDIDDILKEAKVYLKVGSTESQVAWTDSRISYEWDSNRHRPALDELNTDNPGTYLLYVSAMDTTLGIIRVTVVPDEPVKVVPGVEEYFKVNVFNYGGAINSYRQTNDDIQTLNFYDYIDGDIDIGDKAAGASSVSFTTNSKLGSDGYPEIVRNDANKSLKYLFDSEMGANTNGFVKGNGTATSYDPLKNSSYQSQRFTIDVDGLGSGLFQRDENGYYYYDSRQNAATFNIEKNKFELYNYLMEPALGDSNGTDFYPFNIAHEQGNINDRGNYQLRGMLPDDITSSVDAWFGLSIEFDFYMPRDGKINGEDMMFNFSGDDDVWVYIDDALILDLAGCHQIYKGSINFATGEIYEENNSEVQGTKVTNTSTIAERFAEAYGDDLDSSQLNRDTLLDTTRHTIRFFYMERGGSYSNLSVNFNMAAVPTGSLQVSKTAEGFADGEEFTFALLDENDQPYSNLNYITYNMANHDDYFARATDDNGIFKLKDEHIAIFEISKDEKVKIREIRDSGAGILTSCTVNGGAEPLDSEFTTSLITIKENTVYGIDFTNIKRELRPDVVVLDYGKPITVYPLENDEGNFVIDGILTGAPQAGVKTLNTVKLDNGTATVESTVTSTEVEIDEGPAGTLLADFSIPTSGGTHFYPETNPPSVSTTSYRERDRYYINSSGNIGHWVKDSNNNDRNYSLGANGQYCVDTTANILFYRYNDRIAAYSIIDRNRLIAVLTGTYVAPTDTITSSTRDKVVYTPFKYMSSIDTVYYYVSDAKKPASNSDSADLLYSSISFIPATTVYYEDDFGGSQANGGLYINYTGEWITTDGNGNTTAGITANTDTNDRQDRGEVGQGHTPYGYDSSYDDCAQFSNGTASK
ncbi:MAG: hypothetical protein MJ147_07770, partial [Clostridia bacterium]|nr:hypothetical protein [Clostridia bacterium]